MIACIDVGYREDQARAACVVLDRWTDALPRHAVVTEVGGILPYEPGSFYRRELPALRAVLRLLPRLPAIVVIDGYVWLSPQRRPGLGAHLYAEMRGACAVVGVAKTAFHGMDGAALLAPVWRGQSRKALYVTSAGIDLAYAAAAVQAMHGAYRVPTALRMADRLARG